MNHKPRQCALLGVFFGMLLFGAQFALGQDPEVSTASAVDPAPNQAVELPADPIPPADRANVAPPDGPSPDAAPGEPAPVETRKLLQPNAAELLDLGEPADEPVADPEPAADSASPAATAPDLERLHDPIAPPQPKAEPAATAERPDPTAIPLPPAPQESLPLGGAPEQRTAALGSDPAPTAGSSSWILQTLSALAVVIGLIFVLRMILQKLSGQTPIGAPSRIVEVLSRSSVAPRTNVLLLKIDQTVLVVGQTANGLSTLASFDDPEQVARLLTQVNASKPLSITEGFRSVLAGFDRDFDDNPGPQLADADTGSADVGAPDTAADEQFVDRTRNELSGLLSRVRNLRRKDAS